MNHSSAQRDAEFSRRRIELRHGFIGVAIISICLLTIASQVASTRAVANAQADECGPETGLQGQVPLVDQLTGRADAGYCLNMKLIGKNTVEDRGSNMHMTWLDDCAYVGDVSGAGSNGGLAVIDVSDPLEPRMVKTFEEIGGMQPSTVHANEVRRMVVAKGTGYIYILKVPKDCTKPRLVSEYAFESMPHEFQITQDGKTFWGSTALNALDLTNMAKPKPIPYTVEGDVAVGGHDLALSADGTRAYVGANSGQTRIVDISEIQKRAKEPEARVVSAPMPLAEWHTISIGHIDGREYLFSTGEQVVRSACPWTGIGSPNIGSALVIYDITDEASPEYVSTFQLEVNNIANCPLTIPDNANYSAHFGNVDNVDKTTMYLSSWYHSGLRVIDVTDPYNPEEIAYYNPANWGPAPLPGGERTQVLSGTYSYVRYQPKTQEVWVEDMYEGLLVLKLLNPPSP